MNWQRWRRPGLALLATIVGLGLAEIGVRIIGAAPAVKDIHLGDGEDPDLAYQRSANPILGFELKPGYRNEDADLLRSYPAINKHGQRDVERTFTKATGTRRVLLVGDSVVEGGGIADLEHTISRRLEKIWANAAIEVLNFGVSGYCTLAEVELLEKKGLRFGPDLVILLFTENDFHNFNQQAFALGAIHDRPRVVETLFNNSHLFRLGAWRGNLWGLRDELDPMAWNQTAIGGNNVVQGLRRLATLSRRHRFGVLVAVWPRFGGDAVEDPFPSPDDPKRLIVEQIAAANELPIVRLSPWFRRQKEAIEKAGGPLRAFTNGDGLHPSPAGTAIAADALAEVVGADLKMAAVQPLPTQEGSPKAALVARKLGQEKLADDAIVLFNQGVTLMKAGQSDAALAKFQQVIAKRPTHAGALNNVGILHARAGRIPQAGTHFDLAIAAAPEHPDGYVNLGMLALQHRQFSEAERLLTKAVELRPGDAMLVKLLDAAKARRMPDSP